MMKGTIVRNSKISSENPKFIPLKYVLTLTFLVMIIPGILIFSWFNYHEYSEQLYRHYSTLQKQTEENIITSMRLVDISYRVLERTLDKQLKKHLDDFLQAFQDVNENPAEVDLEALKAEINEEVDLYIVNEKGVIIHTTFEKDLGLDFSQWPTFFDRLTQIRESVGYHGGRISTETKTGRFRKYSYLPTPDHQYLLEIGLLTSEFQDIFSNLEMTRIAKKLQKFNPYLENVRIFNRKQQILGDLETVVDDQTKEIIKEVYRTKKHYKEDSSHSFITKHYLAVDLLEPGDLSDETKIIELTYNTAQIVSDLKDKQYSTFIFIGSSIVISLIVSFWIASRIIKPVIQIVGDTRRISKGDLFHEITTNPQNELKILKNSINSMVGEIRSQIIQLKELNQTIEVKSEKNAALVDTFQKFVPVQFLNYIADQGIENIKLGKAEEAVVSILFADIRSFTSFSESIRPQQVLNFLNAYFKRMNMSIHANSGFIDKFLGDGLMALFNQTKNHSKDAESAVNAAIEMQNSLIIYNQERASVPYVPIDVGIGLHGGSVIIGTVGSANRMDSTVLGDNVNLASRLEKLTKYYGVSIIISEIIYDLLPSPESFCIRMLDRVNVKGKTDPLEIYEVFDFESEEIKQKKINNGNLIKQAIEYRKNQEWEKARSIFEEISQSEITLGTVHLEQIEKLTGKNLPINWQGAYALEHK